jgi:hypothetical protein
MGVRPEYAVFKTPSQDVMDQLAGEVEELGFLPVISG